LTEVPCYSDTAVLALAALGLCAAAVILCCNRRFELAIILVLASPWISWISYSNTAKTAEQEAEAGYSTYIRMSVVLLAGFCGILKSVKSWRNNARKPPYYLVLFGCFLAYAALSGFYSIDRKYTLVRSCEFILFFGFLLGFHYWLNGTDRLDRSLNIFFALAACGVIANAAAMAFFPDRAWAWRMPDRLQGLADHPNTLGAFCMLAYPVFAWRYARGGQLQKIGIAALALLTLGMHILSGSRSSLASAALGATSYLAFSGGSASLKKAAAALTCAMAIVLGVTALMVSRPASLARGDSTVTTLTGRTEFWKGCAVLIRERPIRGYGYAVAGKIWEDPRFYREGEFLWLGSARASLHNGYLSLAVGLGLTGLLVWLVFVAAVARRGFCSPANPYKALVMAVILQGLLINFVESALSAGSQIYTSLAFWFFFIIAGKLPALMPAAGRQGR
jgi:O-antigen ligase